MRKKTNLKTMLYNHQEKQRKAQLQSAREAVKKVTIKSTGAKTSSKARGKRAQCRTSTIPICTTDTILLIGEGNFSFTQAVIHSDHASLKFLPPENVVATTYDSEQVCYTKYPDAEDIVQGLRNKGVSVLFGVDARRLDSHKELKKRKWQRVIWNFPHAGLGISDQERNILYNQILILDFLKSVAPLLEEGTIPMLTSGNSRQQEENDSDNMEVGDEDDENKHMRKTSAARERGTVLISLRNTPPYTLWDLPRLAKKPPLPDPSSCFPSLPQPRYAQLRSFTFQRSEWQGYEHRMTKGWVERVGTGADRPEKQKIAEDRMWEFYLAD